MTLNQAFAIRVREYLKEKNMTQYKLEQSTGIFFFFFFFLFFFFFFLFFFYFFFFFLQQHDDFCFKQ